MMFAFGWLIGFGLFWGGVWWYRVRRRRRVHVHGPVSERWISDHLYTRNGDDRQAK